MRSTSARPLGIFGDSVTTDHISPAGSDQERQPGRKISARTRRRARRLQQLRQPPRQRPRHDPRHVCQCPDQKSHGAGRRGRRDAILGPGSRGGRSDGAILPIYDAAEKYKARGRPDRSSSAAKTTAWAAAATGPPKGTNLLGVKAVITKSFERIHRINLVGMGVLPLQFQRQGRLRQSQGPLATPPSISSASAISIKPQSEATAARPSGRRASTSTCRSSSASIRRSKSTTTAPAASCHTCSGRSCARKKPAQN